MFITHKNQRNQKHKKHYFFRVWFVYKMVCFSLDAREIIVRVVSGLVYYVTHTRGRIV